MSFNKDEIDNDLYRTLEEMMSSTKNLLEKSKGTDLTSLEDL